MQQYDIVAWEIGGEIIAMAGSEQGYAFLRQQNSMLQKGDFTSRDETLFQDFLDNIPATLSVGILCPDAQVVNFKSAPLH
jgi:hypothetical protein